MGLVNLISGLVSRRPISLDPKLHFYDVALSSYYFSTPLLFFLECFQLTAAILSEQMKVFAKGKVKLPRDRFGTATWQPFYFRHEHDCLFHFRSREIIAYERIAVYGQIVVYCEINETILGPCSGGIWTLVMKINGSEVRSVKQILQLNPIVFLLKVFSYPETPVSLQAMV